MSVTPTKSPDVSSTAALPLPPGPRRLNPLRDTLAFQRTPLEFITELTSQYGDIAQFRLLNMPVIVINHPDHVRRVLQENHKNYDKDALLFQAARPLLGDGLVTSVGGEKWLRERRLVQPAFHRQRLAGFANIMTRLIEETLERWEQQRSAPIEMGKAIADLTLQVVCDTLINDSDLGPYLQDFISSWITANEVIADFARMPFPPLSFPTPSHRRFQKAVRRMDEIVYGILQKRRKGEGDANDVLSMLMSAVDEETGEGMTDEQLRDEILTILIAGNETSAIALTWSLIMLTKHPDIMQRLQAEVDSVLAGRTPTVEDVSKLSYTQMVLQESLRLYPPAWQLMRHAREDDEMGGYRIPADSLIFWSMYVMHRRPDFWEKPEEFYPEHFSPEQVASRSRNAYVPFSSGPRQCIGNGFAMMEMALALAMMVQRYNFELVGNQEIGLVPLLTLRPAGDVLMRLSPR